MWAVHILLECFHYYHPQTKFAKVMFSQVSVCMCGKGGMHGWGGMAGGACVAGGGMCGKGACVARGCVAGGMHGREVCMAGGTCVAGGTATAAGGTHSTGMHSRLSINLSIWEKEILPA